MLKSGGDLSSKTTGTSQRSEDDVISGLFRGGILPSGKIIPLTHELNALFYIQSEGNSGTNSAIQVEQDAIDSEIIRKSASSLCTL